MNIKLTTSEVDHILTNEYYHFAKTMKYIPHWYTRRAEWSNPESFNAVVQYIREHGVKEKFGKRYFTYYYLNGWKYWTMGSPVEKTILINRAKA